MTFLRLLFIGLLLFSELWSQVCLAEVEKFSQKLVELRGQVETLHDELQQSKEEYQGQMKSLYVQKTELEAEVEREKTRKEQLKQKAQQVRDFIGGKTIDQKSLKPIVGQAIDEVLGYVKQSLPFQHSKRLQELTALQLQLESGKKTPQRVAANLWSFIEDELRLTRESGLYRQTISVDGSELLVEVAKIGMLYLYYKTSQDQYGRAMHGEQGWIFESVSSNKNQSQLSELFESFKKQIRVGLFEIPITMKGGL